MRNAELVGALRRSARAVEAKNHLDSRDLMMIGRSAPALLAALERAERVEAALALAALAHNGGSPHSGACKVCKALASATP